MVLFEEVGSGKQICKDGAEYICGQGDSVAVCSRNDGRVQCGSKIASRIDSNTFLVCNVDGRGQTIVSVDYDICSEGREQVVANLEKWRNALKRKGMKVSRSKT